MEHKLTINRIMWANSSVLSNNKWKRIRVLVSLDVVVSLEDMCIDKSCYKFNPDGSLGRKQWLSFGGPCNFRPRLRDLVEEYFDMRDYLL